MKQRINRATVIIISMICGYMQPGYAEDKPIEQIPCYLKVVNALTSFASRGSNHKKSERIKKCLMDKKTELNIDSKNIDDILKKIMTDKENLTKEDFIKLNLNECNLDERQLEEISQKIKLAELELTQEDIKNSVLDFKNESQNTANPDFMNGYYNVLKYKLYLNDTAQKVYILNVPTSHSISYVKGNNQWEDINEKAGSSTSGEIASCSIDTSVNVIVLNNDGTIKEERIHSEKLIEFSEALRNSRASKRRTKSSSTGSIGYKKDEHMFTRRIEGQWAELFSSEGKVIKFGRKSN
jgi:hypothetical protein